jgi:hypothetical protein
LSEDKVPFKYSCFISYPHDDGRFLRSFVEDLRRAIEDYQGPFLDEPVYLDTKRLRGGQFWSEALAEAICHSICMVVVYTPKYKRHTYCLREFAAMEKLENLRLGKIQSLVDDDGLIIPIILRGEDDIPDKIKLRRQYYDFSKYTLLDQDMGTNPNYVKEIDEIAKTIHRLFEAFLRLGEDMCGDCGMFSIPAEQEIELWLDQPSIPPFPGRTGKP